MYQTANSTVESIYIYSAASDLILSSGSLLLASELEEFPDEGIQRLLEHTEELLDVIGDMEQSGTGSREVTLDGGEKYFVSCLHSEASGWDYIKITRWNEVFGILRSLTEWTIIIVAVIVGLMLLMIARSAVSVLRLQRLL